MVKVNNANIGRGENVEEGGSSKGRVGKGKRVPSGVRAPDRFIFVKKASNFDEWTRKRRKIAPGHRVDLNDMKSIEIIPNLFNNIGWIFTKGEVLKRHEDRNVNKLDAYGRLLHYMISNIIIPNVGHESSITNMHLFVMLALHEHRRMNFGFMAIEHMLATQSSSTKCLPYSCFLMKIFQYFILNLVGVGDHIGPGKIYNKHTFKRMGFERNEEGMLVRGGQDENDEENEEQEAMNVEEEESVEEMEEKTHRREIRQKKR
ncbi:hypothetical protein M9H77_14387 [Catharanthus roseus]|uniref:Uncharacterized protein n=1 Tax=Catharanthus roseus TaxID=4058 RepID=A0ACC0BN57_CATRO|nr:hypothetical protein M9H77_14387 [Catharanthus roseus]